jgi:hypothetical protein
LLLSHSSVSKSWLVGKSPTRTLGRSRRLTGYAGHPRLNRPVNQPLAQEPLPLKNHGDHEIAQIGPGAPGPGSPPQVVKKASKNSQKYVTNMPFHAAFFTFRPNKTRRFTSKRMPTHRPFHSTGLPLPFRRPRSGQKPLFCPLIDLFENRFVSKIMSAYNPTNPAPRQPCILRALTANEWHPRTLKTLAPPQGSVGPTAGGWPHRRWLATIASWPRCGLFGWENRGEALISRTSHAPGEKEKCI